MAGVTPKDWNRPAVVCATVICSAPSLPSKLVGITWTSASASNECERERHSRKFSGCTATVVFESDGCSRSVTRRPESGYGSGRSSTALTKLKIVVFAPMPSASESTATIVKPGLLRSERRA